MDCAFLYRTQGVNQLIT